MKILYRPLNAIASALGAVLAGAVFNRLWRIVARSTQAPEATDRAFPTWQVVVAAGVQGALVGAVKAAVDRAGAVGYEKATGAWPRDD